MAENQRWEDIAYLDVVVMDDIREAMVAGDAIAIVDCANAQLRWVNGPAAAFFGLPQIGPMIDIVEPQGFTSAKRQIKSGLSRLSDVPQPLLIRVQKGLQSKLVQAHIRLLTTLFDGAAHAMIRFDASGLAQEGERLRHMLSSIFLDEATSAIIDGDGAVIADDGRFSPSRFDADLRAQLARETAHEEDRLIKRIVTLADGSRAAVGVGRLDEMPARYLLVQMLQTLDSAPAVDIGEAPAPQNKGTSAEDTGASADEDEENDAYILPGATIRSNPKPLTSEPAPLPDLRVPEPDLSTLPYTPDNASAPIRFVWKTDSDGIFIDVSPEFAKAVGPQAANIEGLSFRHVVEALSLDPGGTIAASLDRRDTWSGKSVLWPVQGNDLRVPVDLAALPYYNRDRDFQGYRGFGIARMADMLVDPDAYGVDIARRLRGDAGDDDQASSEALGTNTQLADDTDDPFQGETPVFEGASLSPRRRVSDTPSIELDEPDHEDVAPDELLPDDHPDDAAKTGPLNALSEAEARAFAKIGVKLGRTDDDAVQDLADPLSGSDDEDEDDDEGHSTVADSQIDEGYYEPIAKIEADEPELSSSPDAALGPDILDGLPLPLLIVREETVLFANRAFSALTQFESADAINDMGLDVLFAENTPRLENGNSPDTDGQSHRPVPIQLADGSTIDARVHLQIIPWQKQTALMFAFEPMQAAPDDRARDAETQDMKTPSPEFFDVLAKPEGAAPISAEEAAELSAILDTATDGIILVDSHGMIRSINGSASALFGYDSDEITDKSFSILFAHESQRAAMDYLDSMANNGVASVLNEGREVLGRESKGGFIPLFMTIGRLPAAGGYCAVLRDITSWKQTEQALQEAKREAETASSTKSEFLAKISHEIRTPLNAIIGFSEIMSEERFGPINNDRYKGYLVDINKSGRHVLDLVNDLLDISKIESGNQNLEFESVSLNEPIAEAISMIQPQANRNRIIVRSSLETDVPPVVADLRSVKQITLNLLSNAVRFTPDGGQVIVSTHYASNGSVIVRIRDTGIGMSRKELESALQPFQQVATIGKSRGDGTGLGLPLTKALVEANRAEFSIVSEPGQGTVVKIVFPSARVLAS